MRIRMSLALLLAMLLEVSSGCSGAVTNSPAPSGTPISSAQPTSAHTSSPTDATVSPASSQSPAPETPAPNAGALTALPDILGYSFSVVEDTRHLPHVLYAGSWDEGMSQDNLYASSLYSFDTATGEYSLILESPCAYPVVLHGIGEFFDVVFTATDNDILAYDASTLMKIPSLCYPTNISLFQKEGQYVSAYLVGWDERSLALCIDRYDKNTLEWLGFENYIYNWEASTLSGPNEGYWDDDNSDTYYAYLAEYENGPTAQGDICTLNGYLYRWYQCSYHDTESGSDYFYTLIYRENGEQRVRVHLERSTMSVSFVEGSIEESSGASGKFSMSDTNGSHTFSIQANSGRVSPS